MEAGRGDDHECSLAQEQRKLQGSRNENFFLFWSMTSFTLEWISQSSCPENTPATLSCIGMKKNLCSAKLIQLFFFKSFCHSQEAPSSLDHNNLAHPYTHKQWAVLEGAAPDLSQKIKLSPEIIVFIRLEKGRARGDLPGALRDEKNNKPKLDQDAGRRKAPASRNGFDLKRVTNVINKLWMNVFLQPNARASIRRRGALIGCSRRVARKANYRNSFCNGARGF